MNSHLPSIKYEPEVLEGALAAGCGGGGRPEGECGDVPGEERDVGLEEGEDEGAQREVGHLLQHVVEVAHRDGARLHDEY